jgi:NADH dehydrogenase (ubiquinone) Fe-S protein 8
MLVAATRLSFVDPQIARRLLSTSACAHAEHNLQSKLSDTKLRPVQPQTTQQPLEGDPYRRGPSAIDKAVHLFFFTEILRGIPVDSSKPFLSLNGSRNVGCNGEFLPSALYYHVSL